MNHSGPRRGWLTLCLCATAGWAALSPAAATLTGRSALAAPNAACARPASTAPSIDAAATPVASPVAAAATPVAGDSAQGQPLNAQASAQIEQVVAAVAACQTSGDYQTLTDLVSTTYLSDVYGGGARLSVAQFLQLSKDLPAQAVEIQSVSDVRVNAKGVISADVVSIAGRQLLHGRWSFVAKVDASGDNTGTEAGQSNGTWVVDSVTPLDVAVPAGAQEINLKINDKAYGPAKMTGKRGGDLVFNGTNSGKQDHELLVLRLPKGLKTADLLLSTGPTLPKGVVFIGQVTIPAKSDGQLVLTDMPRGSYVIVDLLPDPNGNPYLAHGFASSLTISLAARLHLTLQNGPSPPTPLPMLGEGN